MKSSSCTYTGPVTEGLVGLIVSPQYIIARICRCQVINNSATSQLKINSIDYVLIVNKLITNHNIKMDVWGNWCEIHVIISRA